MPDRLSPLDVSFLYLEEPTTPMHVGSVLVFEPTAGPVDHATLIRYVQARIAYVPRYRQRVRAVPGRLANPVWVDDERFDISYHVRRSGLPRPGTRHQLEELVARLQARHLDRSRPLWELTLVEGLEGGRFAVITKVHQALVDGVHAVDLGQMVLDESPGGYDPPTQLWRPAPEPSLVELVVGAVADSVRAPRQILDTLRADMADIQAGAGRLFDVVGGLAARTATRPTPRSPLNPDIGGHRRFRMVATDLADHRAVRNHLLTPPRPRRGKAVFSAQGARRVGREAEPAPGLDGGRALDHDPGRDRDDDPLAVVTVGGIDGSPNGVVPRVEPTINDVILATLAGALRAWLLTRGEPVRPSSLLRALVPMSVRAGDALASPLGSGVSSILVDLPTGEASPLIRLHQVAYQTRAHREGSQAVSARTIAGIAGFAPPTLHSLGARVASGLSRRLFNLVVTNVPGPQLPLFLDGSRMLASYPVIPLAKGQALSVGLTSYDGGVYYGLHGDRDAMPDLEILGQCVVESLAELVEAVR
ncbi:MAG TPA: wax ester/triacylglycerol synthase family O-acyltransferase [Kineosporiaceae bacterium]